MIRPGWVSEWGRRDLITKDRGSGAGWLYTEETLPRRGRCSDPDSRTGTCILKGVRLEGQRGRSKERRETEREVCDWWDVNVRRRRKRTHQRRRRRTDRIEDVFRKRWGRKSRWEIRNDPTRGKKCLFPDRKVTSESPLSLITLLSRCSNEGRG